MENICINLKPDCKIESQTRTNDTIVLDGTYKNTRVIVVKLNWQELLSSVNHILKPDIIIATGTFEIVSFVGLLKKSSFHHL